MNRIEFGAAHLSGRLFARNGMLLPFSGAGFTLRRRQCHPVSLKCGTVSCKRMHAVFFGCKMKDVLLYEEGPPAIDDRSTQAFSCVREEALQCLSRKEEAGFTRYSPWWF
ncbi:MAG: hypothetical protein Q4D92_02220 [Slackia sp.]|nr:hypothetical protein [Slackia sp.]